MQALGTALGAYLVFVGLVFLMQRSLLYPASRDLPQLEGKAGLGIREITTETHDGLRLAHWYRPPQAPDAPLLVVFHGNAGHIGDRASKFASLFRNGYGFLLVGYRGYGGNPGRPSESDMTEDARGVMAWLADEGVAPQQVVLYGESLGTGLAVKMALEHPVAAVVLESPYTSIAALAQLHYWYLPARWLILDKWDSLSRIDELSQPLLVIHGARDRIIPPRYGARLFEAAPEPKEHFVVEGAGHNDLYEFPEVPDRVIDFLSRRVAPAIR